VMQGGCQLSQAPCQYTFLLQMHAWKPEFAVLHALLLGILYNHSCYRSNAEDDERRGHQLHQGSREKR
jgi:hypothetical protein